MGSSAERAAGSQRGIKAVNPIVSTQQDQTFGYGLYNRAVHPEFFELRSRRVVRHEGYELESWLMGGGHALRFSTGSCCYSEVICGSETALPEANCLNSFICIGEHDIDEKFENDGVGYIATIQSETLGENLYRATFEEMLDYADESGAQVDRWNDESGASMSIVDVQRLHNQVHAQCYHLIARGGVVLRTQTIFEQK